MDYSKKIKQGDVSTTLDTRTRNEGKLAFLPLPLISTERSEWRNLSSYQYQNKDVYTLRYNLK